MCIITVYYYYYYYYYIASPWQKATGRVNLKIKRVFAVPYIIELIIMINNNNTYNRRVVTQHARETKTVSR